MKYHNEQCLEWAIIKKDIWRPGYVLSHNICCIFFVLVVLFQIFGLLGSYLPGEKSEKTIFLIQRRDWYYQSGDFHKWLFLGPIEQSVCKKYPESVEQCKKPEERILHLMKALHHKHISYFRQYFCLKLCQKLF